MGKHSKKDDFETDIPDMGDLKDQLNDRADPGEGIGDSSLSPIDTF